MNSKPLKEGNMIFLQSTLMDLFYIVGGMIGEKVKAKKIDAPPSQWELLDGDKVVKIAEKQEKLLPSDVMTALRQQREIVFPAVKGERKKKDSLSQMMKGLPCEVIEEILAVLASVRAEEDEEVLAMVGEEKEEGGDNESES